MDESIKEREFYNTLWNYFTQHANQRIQLINFYIILETFLFAGLFALVKEAITDQCFTYKLICILISISSIFFSFVFYNLDTRTKQMIHTCEKSIKILENDYESSFSSDLMIFNKEARFTPLQRKWNWFPLSYSKSFKALFLFFSIIGSICLIYFIFFYHAKEDTIDTINLYLYKISK